MKSAIEWLKANGYTVGHTRQEWRCYGVVEMYRRVRTEGAVCTTNDRLSIYINAWPPLPLGKAGLEVELVGGREPLHWLHLKAYCIDAADAAEAVPRAERVLLAAWDAAVAAEVGVGDGTDPVPSEPAILDEPAWQALAPLSTRTSKALRDRLPASLWGDDCGGREVAVRELCGCTEAQLLKLRNFARKSLKEVEVALAFHGLRLSTLEEWFQRQEKR